MGCLQTQGHAAPTTQEINESYHMLSAMPCGWCLARSGAAAVPYYLVRCFIPRGASCATVWYPSASGNVDDKPDLLVNTHHTPIPVEAVRKMQNRRLIMSAIVPFVFGASICCAATNVWAGAEAVWPTKEWFTSAPEEQGMDSSMLAKLVAFGGSHGFDSVLVVRHGRIVTEAYYAAYTADIPHEIFSSTKAVTGTLLGMVYKDGLLDRLDHPMLDFFADRHAVNVDDRKKAITVQNLLDMTSGLDWDQGFENGKEQSRIDLERSSNWTQFVLDRPMAHTLGEVFNYSNGDPNLVSAIITKLTGKLAEDYARESFLAR
jgi:Beta-lactamase